MTGRMLYQPPPQHECQTPERAAFGAVWQCGCGRRYTCIKRPTPPRGLVSVNSCMWVRRYWPWPRKPQSTNR